MEKLVRRCELENRHATTDNALWLTVVFTTLTATKRALQYSSQLAIDLGARIQLVIPEVVPYPLPLHRPAADPEIRARHFIGITEDLARIDVLLCRDRKECLLQHLPSGCLILMSAGSRWWPAQMRRLSRLLRRAGHRVIVAPTNSPACHRTTKGNQA